MGYLFPQKLEQVWLVNYSCCVCSITDWWQVEGSAALVNEHLNIISKTWNFFSNSAFLMVWFLINLCGVKDIFFRSLLSLNLWMNRSI